MYPVLSHSSAADAGGLYNTGDICSKPVQEVTTKTEHHRELRSGIQSQISSGVCSQVSTENITGNVESEMMVRFCLEYTVR